MGVLEETQREDLRFRQAIREAAETCEAGELNGRVEKLAEESKQRQREILVRYNPQLQHAEASTS